MGTLPARLQNHLQEKASTDTGLHASQLPTCMRCKATRLRSRSGHSVIPMRSLKTVARIVPSHGYLVVTPRLPLTWYSMFRQHSDRRRQQQYERTSQHTFGQLKNAHRPIRPAPRRDDRDGGMRCVSLYRLAAEQPPSGNNQWLAFPRCLIQ